MASAGERLKKIRLEKGLTLEDVHKQTKIHLNILKAIEDDSLIGLNPVYIKGFLKIYCRFLGLDPKDYIPDYQQPRPQVKIVKEASILDRQENPLSLLRTVYGKLNTFRRINIKKKAVFVVALAIFSCLGLFILGKFISSRRSLHAKEGEVSIRKPQKTKEQAARKEILSTLRLGLRAREDCWVSLKVDGRLVFRAILKKGKFESWKANEKIEFSLGNAGVVEVELNNRILPPLGRKGQSLKNIVVTKEEGLRVLR